MNPSIPDVSKLSFDDAHVNKERNHGVTELEAKNVIFRMRCFRQQNGMDAFTNYTVIKVRLLLITRTILSEQRLRESNTMMLLRQRWRC